MGCSLLSVVIERQAFYHRVVAEALAQLVDRLLGFRGPSVDEIGRRVRESNRIAEAAVVQAEQTDGRIGKLSRAAQEIGSIDRRACRQVFDDRFTVAHMAENYLRVYRSAICDQKTVTHAMPLQVQTE